MYSFSLKAALVFLLFNSFLGCSISGSQIVVYGYSGYVTLPAKVTFNTQKIYSINSCFANTGEK